MRNFPSSSNILLIRGCYSNHRTLFITYLLEEDRILIETSSGGRNALRPSLRQVLRFSVVGGLNTLVDILILNGLLGLFPTTSTHMLLAYNALAYGSGAVNSFLLNKYWTFGSRQKATRTELIRFTLTTLCGMGWSSTILWLVGTLLHPFVGNATLWANASKGVAIAGTILISYLGMRLWVFVRKDSHQNRPNSEGGARKPFIQQLLVSQKHPC